MAEAQGWGEILQRDWDVPRGTVERLEAFQNHLYVENRTQNLTRIPETDFYQGHLRDCLELWNLGWTRGVCMDWGSGGGIPGIPLAILTNSRWILVESEKRKASFLESAVRDLGLDRQIEVRAERGEAVLAEEPADWVVARALGSIAKISKLLPSCSTWNNLALFKGPRYQQEWQNYLEKTKKNKFRLIRTHFYSIQNNKSPLTRSLLHIRPDQPPA